MPLTRPTASQVNFDVTNVTDPLVRFNSGQSGTNDKDIGIVFERGSQTNVALLWDESADKFVLVNTSEDGTTSGNVTISSYANLQANDIVSGNINNTGTVTAGTMTDGTVSFNAGNITGVDTLRIDQTGTGLRMTNVGAFDNDGSNNFRIFATSDLQLKANGDTGGGLTIDATNQDVTITNDLRVTAGQFYYGGTAVTSTATELNLLDGVTGTLVTEAGTQTLTNKTITSPTISNPTLTGTYTFTSDATSTPAMTLTANSINDGVGALRINGSQADIYLNPSTATHTTVTFAVNDDQRLAFGMDNNSDFYITRRTGGSWYNDTFVIDRDTGLLSLGYDLSVAGDATITGNLTASSLNVNNQSTLATSSQTLATTSQTAIDTFSASAFRSCKYLIQATNTVSSEYQATEAIIVHNGTTSYMSTYGITYTGSAELATFATDINSGSVRLLATGANANSTQYKVTRITVVV